MVSNNRMKFVSLKRSTDPDKKYMATFEDNGRTKTTHFGAAGMTDYTLSKDPERRAAYLRRHQANENWNDPTSAGALSRWLLWGPSTSLRENLNAFIKRFGLS